eukprot:COSAG05_NODE_4321_length_1567_cov_329.445504_1_plen_143_part_10
MCGIRVCLSERQWSLCCCGVARADRRADDPVAAMPLHNHGERGSGAIAALELGGGSDGSGRLVSAGADAAVCVVEPRTGWVARHTWHVPDFVYSLRLVEAPGSSSSSGQPPQAVALAGCGDGTVHTFDVVDGVRTASHRRLYP